MVIKVMETYTDSIDVKYEAVARMLGYGRLSIIFRFLIPMAKPGIFFASILGFMRALGEFGASVTVAGAID